MYTYIHIYIDTHTYIELFSFLRPVDHIVQGPSWEAPSRNHRAKQAKGSIKFRVIFRNSALCFYVSGFSDLF